MNVKIVHVMKIQRVQIALDTTIAALMMASMETVLIVEVLLQFMMTNIFFRI